MASKTLKERILKTCHAFLQDNEQGFTELSKSKKSEFYQSFRTYIVNGGGLEQMLCRGSNETLKRQWKQQNVGEARKLHPILEDDKVQTLSVNALIDQMKDLNSTATSNFESSCHDIVLLENAVEEFVLAESKRLMKKVLSEPRFTQHKSLQLYAFTTEYEQRKGLITRFKEQDPTLLGIQQSEDADQKQWDLYDHYRRTLMPQGHLVDDDENLIKALSSSVAGMIKRDPKQGTFSMSPWRLEIQYIAAKIKERLRCSRYFHKPEGYLALSLMSGQLSHTLEACKLLLREQEEQDSHDGKEVAIEYLIRELYNFSGTSIDVMAQNESNPELTSTIVQKTMAVRDFDELPQLISMFTNFTTEQSRSDAFIASDKQPTALENLYSLVFFLRFMANSIKKANQTTSTNSLFQHALVIDQSAQTYKLLLELLKKIKELAIKVSDKKQKEIIFYLFDGFKEILLNNLQALYESERTGLDIFEDQLPTTYYSDALSYVLWRIKTKEEDSNATKDLNKWQKLLFFTDFSSLKLLYEQSELKEHASLCQLHGKNMPSLLDFQTELPKLIEGLAVVKTDENTKEFQDILKLTRDLTTIAIEQKNPALGDLIREVFKRKIEQTPEEGSDQKLLLNLIAPMLMATLFLRSDNSQSRIASVLADICNQGAKFRQNKFTSDLMRMMTADSLNMLKNIKEVASEEISNKVNLPWKTVVQNIDIRANDGDKHYEDFQAVKDESSEFSLPQISEIGFQVTKFIIGVSIFYRDGSSFERKGTSTDIPVTYMSIKMQRGEHITAIHARQGSWTDQVTVFTNFGRSLKAGGEGGTLKEPAFPPKAYVVGIDTHFHHSLTRLTVHYVNLDEVPVCQTDPLVSLVLESDLLSKGIEPKHMNIFSEKVIDEIKVVQDTVGKPILDASVMNAPSSDGTTMISTTDIPNQNLVDADCGSDLHMQIIHSGENEFLDDFIEVLQLLLKESREPIRTQLFIGQENGMAATRACFAVIVKLSGLTSNLEQIIVSLELQEADFDAETRQERLKQMKEEVKTNTSNLPLLFKEWCNATKMRKWLKDQQLAQNLDLFNEEDAAKFMKILKSVVSKAEFLVKLEKPLHFNTMDPKDEIFELSYKIPSYARDNKKDEEELKETPVESLQIWREHYEDWKSSLKTQGAIRSQQQKQQEIRSIGTSSILVCLQHAEITKDILISISETNYLNSCNRLAGLQILEQIVALIQVAQDETPNKVSLLQIRNVAAALQKGLNSDYEKENKHYLNGIFNCGDHIQSLIRKSFFNVLRGISNYFAHAEKGFMIELLSCFDWNFKARDFEELNDMKVFKLLHTGVARQVKAAEGQVVQQNIVLESWLRQPKSQLTAELQIISSNMYMGIVSRLAEPEAQKIIFGKHEEKKTGVGSLLRNSSVVNVNAAQLLLAEEFGIMFREFHEFVLVANRIGRYLTLDELSRYQHSGESSSFINEQMPRLINETMEKIIKNAPYEEREEEQKNSKLTHGSSVQVAHPEEVKIEFPAEKPWLKAKADKKKQAEKPKKLYDATRYTQEQMEVLELLDNSVELSQRQAQIHEEIKEMDDNDLACMFAEDEDDYEDPAPEIPVTILVKVLAKDNVDIPRLRQKIVQSYRDFKESTNIARYLNLVQIFVKVAMKAPYPLEMLQNVANPYHIKTLIQMLFQVSVQYKLQILTIFQTLLRIQVPLSIFDEGVKDLKIKFRTATSIDFQSSFAKCFFQAALQIQSKTWDSSFSEEKRGGMQDVSIYLTRTVALCLKVQASSPDAKPHCEDLSNACCQIADLSQQEVTTLMQVMEANCTMPICGDNILFAADNKDGQPETAKILSWNERQNVFNDNKYQKGCLILPNFVPDSLISLDLNQLAFQALTEQLSTLSVLLKEQDAAQTLEIVYIVKLLILSVMKQKESLSSLKKEERQQLIYALSKITQFQGEEHKEEDNNLYTTSLIEQALAIQLRDEIEMVLPSGVDPFDQAEDSSIQTTIDLQIRKRSSTIKKKKQSAAGNKYSKQLLSAAKKRSANSPKKQKKETSAKEKLVNSMYKDFIATESEVIEMNNAIIEICYNSGCSLLEMLYAINESLAEGKRNQTTDEIVEMFNEQLVQLAENEDESKDEEMEMQFIELVTKKIEKIETVYKPESFKTDVLSKINLEKAILEVEAKTHGMSSLMRSRVQDKIFSDKSQYQMFASQMKDIGSNVTTFKQKFDDDIAKSKLSTTWPLTDLPVPCSPLSENKKELKCAQILAKRFAEKLLFTIFDPTIDTKSGVEEDESQDIADVIANGVIMTQDSLKTCYDSVYRSVEEGIRSYSKSVEIFNACNGIECLWEVSFSENFKIQSNLTTDFNCLRQLADYAFTKSMVAITSTESLADRCEEFLNHKLIQNFQKTEELQAKSENFLKYLIESVINQTCDGFAFKMNPPPKFSSNLVSALSYSPKQQASTMELVERVKLITNSILKSNSDLIIGTFAPDLLNLTLYAVMIEKSSLQDKRLLLDQAFQIVEIFRSEEKLPVFIEMGTWEKIVQSQVLQRALDEIVSVNIQPENDQVDFTDKVAQSPLYVILLFQLRSEIDEINKMAQVIQAPKDHKTYETNKDTQRIQKFLDSKLTQPLKSTDLASKLIDSFLASNSFEDKFKSEFTVPINNIQDAEEWTNLNFEFNDGAIATFKIEPQSEADAEKLSMMEFEVKYAESGSSTKPESIKFFSNAPTDKQEISHQQIKIRCTGSTSITNIEAIGHEDKLRRGYSRVQYVLPSSNRSAVYVVTDQSIHYEGPDFSKEIILPEDFVLSEHKIVQIQDFGPIGIGTYYNQVFKTDLGKQFTNGKSPELIEDKIGDSKVVHAVIKENIRVYLTADKKMHTQGLFEMLSSEEGRAVRNLADIDIPNRFECFTEGDVISDIQFGGKGKDKYVIATMIRNGQKLLYSKGFYKKVLLENGRPEGVSDFSLLAGQSARTSFEQVFLFDTVAFASDHKGQLWVLGGKMALQDEEIFPVPLGCELFESRQRSNLIDVVREQFEIESTDKLTVRDISYSESLPQSIMLVKLNQTTSEGNNSQELRILLQNDGNGKYLISKIEQESAFIFQNKLWAVTPCSADDEESKIPPAVLKVEFKPLKRNQNNISYDRLVREIAKAESEELYEQLVTVQKLSEDRALYVKVYRAMNTWVRARIENACPSNEQLELMISECNSEFAKNDEDFYNPLAIWNDQYKESDILKMVTAIAQINIDLSLRPGSLLSTIRNLVMNDPLLEESLMKERLNQEADIPSIRMCAQFCKVNFVLLGRLQDDLFSQAEKPASHGAQIEIDFFRHKAAQFALDGKVDHGLGDTIFTQLFNNMESRDKDHYKKYWRTDDPAGRIYRANFKGEGSIDASGPYREIMDNISNEICSSVLPILIPTENQHHEHGDLRECFVLNHQATTTINLKQIHHFGLIIGFAIRSTQTWNMALHPLIWKNIVGLALDYDEDLKTSDKFMHQMFQSYRELADQCRPKQEHTMSEEDFQLNIGNQCFTIDFGLGDTELVPDGASIPVTTANLDKYIKLASMKLLNKASVQMEHFLSGVHYVISKSALQCLSWRGAEVRAMGEPFIDIALLRKYTKDESGNPANTMKWFWEVLTEMEEEDKQKYLKFVNSRSKLPTNPTVGRKHKITPYTKSDTALPQAHTCFFQIDLPAYKSKEILREKILIAIRFCGEIDTD